MRTKTFHEIEHEAWSDRAGYYDALFGAISTQASDGVLEGIAPLQGKRHLDMACGTGHLVAAAAWRGAQSEGIDFAEAMISAARTNYPQRKFQVADARELPYESGVFDVVTCCFGLSHMENPQSAVVEAYRVLKTGGYFAFTLWYGPDDGGELFAISKAVLERNLAVSIMLPAEWTQLRFADERVCAVIAHQAGFSPPVFRRLAIEWQTDAAQNVLEIIDRLAIRTRLLIDRQPADVRQRIYEEILAEAETHRVDRYIVIKCPAMLAVVQKLHERRK